MAVSDEVGRGRWNVGVRFMPGCEGGKHRTRIRRWQNRSGKARNSVRVLPMQFDLKEDVVSLTDFARNTKQHAKELALGGRARILTQNGKASVVALSLDAFEQMAHDAEEYRMDLRLRGALESLAAGEAGAPVKTVMGRLRKRASQRRASR